MACFHWKSEGNSFSVAEISARWQGWNNHAITWEISQGIVHKGSTHAFMNLQPGLKFLVDYIGNFSPINRAENLISRISNRAEVSAG